MEAPKLCAGLAGLAGETVRRVRGLLARDVHAGEGQEEADQIHRGGQLLPAARIHRPAGQSHPRASKNGIALRS